jgi:ATP-binding cassette, subfamily B, bacterial
MPFLAVRGARRVPFIPQMEATECGAASLAMVLAAHGHHAPLSEVRRACGVSRDGASAFALLSAARAYRLDSEGVKVELEELRQLPLPAILHWDFAHFMVLERLRGERAVLVDPAAGRQVLELKQLRPHFTGVALVFAPGDGFAPRGRPRLSLARYRDLLRRFLPSLGQLLAASLMLQMLGLALPVATQLLIDGVITTGRASWLWALALGLTGALTTRALLDLVRSWVIQGLQASMDLGLMARFVEHLLRLPLPFFSQRNPGDLIQRVQNNSIVRALFSSQSISALLDALLILGFAGLMLAYHVGVGALVLLLGAGRVGLAAALRQRLRQVSVAEQTACGRESSALLDALSALETTKSSGAEGLLAERGANRTSERIHWSLERRRIEIAQTHLMVLLQGLAAATVFWVGGRNVLAERMSLGVFAALLTLQGLFMSRLDTLLRAVTQLQYVGGHLLRLDDVLETERERSGQSDPGRLQGAIELKDVSFGYSTAAPLAVQRASASIRPGEMVALVGPSGAGKSTLARLLLGLYLPTEGSVRFDGRDLRELDLSAVRRQVGVVLQETFLFDDTLRANLCLDLHVSPADLAAAATAACLREVVEARSGGYDARVGENGILFSGGERQRLALARALVHRPAVLLLDEATSALDLETEARIHANLAGLRCTRIIIAHRLATVRRADRILVMDGGRIVQQGGFDQLAASPGPFRQLLQSQYGQQGP